MNYKKFALSRKYKKGRCSETPYSMGGHMIGVVPIYSVLDNGLPGDVAREICICCEKWFKKSWFIPINQPHTIEKG